MNPSRQMAIGWFYILFMLSVAIPAAGQVVDSSTLDGKVIVGYQGWFTTPGGGYSDRWGHWTRDLTIPTGATGNLVVDMYPDLREFDRDELMPTAMTLGGGPAFLYAGRTAKTVRRHVRWMREYGIDGAFLQRFPRSHLDDVDYARQLNETLWNFRSASADYGRVFAVMFDVSVLRESDDWVTFIKNDWIGLVDAGLTSDGRYIKHEGRPVLGLWGLGFTHNVPSDPRVARELIEWFKSGAPPAYRATIFGGVPAYWRTLNGDSRAEPEWASVYRSFDIVSPWTVGRYVNSNGVDDWRSQRLEPDLAALQLAGIEYSPVIWPGFSWRNLTGDSPNAIPRDAGRFLWRQALSAKNAGAKMLYIAMFDEVDEGTAIYKTAETRAQAPDQGYWLTLDADGYALPSDWYLRVTHDIGSMFRNQGSAPMTLPVAPGPASSEPMFFDYTLPAPNPAFPNCPGGYFVATIDDGPAPGVSPGIFGLSLLLNPPGSLRLDGGLNFGGSLDGSQVAFSGFNVQNDANEPQLLTLTITGNPSSSQSATLPVIVTVIRQLPVGDSETLFRVSVTLSLNETFAHTLTIQPGYHVVTVAPAGAASSPGGAADGQVYVSLGSQFVDRPGGGFFGGVVVGGYHAAPPFGDSSGFAAFCLGTSHAATARLFSAPSYGITGARDLRLRLLDHLNRTVISVPSGH